MNDLDDIDAYFEDLGLLPEMTTKHTVQGGHMAYERNIYANDSEYIFIKRCKEMPGMSNEQKKHSLDYLEKELSIINQLSFQPYIPEFAELKNNALIMPAYPIDHDWHWSLPQDELPQAKYIQHILEILHQKENLQVDYTHENIVDTAETLQTDGWEKLRSIPDIKDTVTAAYSLFKPQLMGQQNQTAVNLISNLSELVAQYRPVTHTKLTAFSHHDARINNIAWRANGQVRIVDWSWAGMGLPQSDSTMFLIDLAKNGVDITEYTPDYLNQKHAFILLGYWLARSLEPGSHNPGVRLQQFTSALTAYGLVA